MRRLLPLLALALVASPVRATWSIVAVDVATGECAVISTTCIPNDPIERAVPVLVVGKGAAAVQYLRDPGAVRRNFIRAGFLAGDTPLAIHQGLGQTFTGQGLRQYGIVSVDGAPFAFTGQGVDDAEEHVVGQVGTIRYAIQGNSLAGVAVITAAEAAFVGTAGDLGQRLFAAMEAARAMGGDGRCSCAAYDPFCQDLAVCGPDVCGTPPPSFTKQSHAAHVALARSGDADGPCDQQAGCTQGDYYFEAVFDGGVNDPDPILVVTADWQAWRAALAGRPDHHRSTVALEAASLPADGVTTRAVVVELVDVDGIPLRVGGAAVSASAEAGLVTVGTPADLGDGRYRFEVTAGTAAGLERLVVVADDGVRPVTLAPFPTLELTRPAPLSVGFDEVSAAAPPAVPFVLSGAPGASYFLFASTAGTQPGIPLGQALLPLNPSPALLCSVLDAGGPLLPDSTGVLDAAGRAEPGFVPTPGLLAGLVGQHLDWAAVLVAGGAWSATNVVGLDVLP